MNVKVYGNATATGLYAVTADAPVNPSCDGNWNPLIL